MAQIHKYDTNTWIMHEYYINKYIPPRYLVRSHIRVAHEVYSYFIKQSGYKSLIFLVYLVLLLTLSNSMQQHMYYSEFNIVLQSTNTGLLVLGLA